MRVPENTGSTSAMFCRRTTCRLIMVVVFLFAACAVQADIFTQPEEWRWLRFSTGSGLPSTEINALCETPSGTVWVSTMAGPAWYNGFFWQHLDSASGIPDSAASALFPFGRDSVVILAQGRLYIGNTRGFSPLLRSEHKIHQPVLAAVQCGRDSVFFISSGNGRPGQLYLYHRNTVVPVSMPSSATSAASVKPLPSPLFHTRNNRIWLNTYEGLYRLGGTGWQLMYRHYLQPTVSAVIEDSSGNGFFFIAAGSRQGFWEFRNNGSINYTRIGNNSALISADLAPDGEVTAVYSNGVINRFRRGAWSLLTSGQTGTVGTTFIRYRANGDLWLQSQTALSLYRSSLQRWQYHSYSYDNACNHVNEILQTRDGAVWVATGYGVHVHRRGEPVRSFTSINGTELGGVTALAEDGDGNIWIGSGSSFEGAFRWNGSTWKHVYKPDGLDAPRIHKIRRDRKGRLWFLSMRPLPLSTEGNGAFVYENGHFTQWSIAQGLPNGRVYSFADDRKGALWFGTLHGLSRWYNGSWTHWPFSPERRERLFALAVDSSDRVWFSHFSQGFGYVDRDSLRMISIPVSTNRFNSNDLIVVDLRVDQRNRLWIATQGNGLYCYNNGNFSNIGVTMGLASMNLWPILPAGDHVYIGTIGRGLNILSLDEQHHPPPVVIFEKPVVEERTALLRWRPYAYWEHIPSDEIQTRYRLGNDKWSEWSSKHEIFFHNLPSGTHKLVVEVKDMFASVSNQQYISSFEIPAPFYTHHWFLLPVGLLLTVTLVLAADAISRRRRYTAELQRINAELESRIRERTAALEMSNTHLRSEVEQRLQAENELRLALSKEKELSELKTRFVSMVSHEFRTPLSAILASSDVLDRYYARLTDEEKSKYYDRIRDSVARITALMDDVLFIGNAGAGRLAFIPMTLDPDAYCRDLLATLPQQQMHRVSYSFEGVTEVTLDSKLLRLILLNLLSNAFTYSSTSSSVDLSLRTTPNDLTIVVKDRGIGIPREDLDKVFDTFHRGTNIGTLPGSGLGLSIVKECVDLHRGTITVQSSPEQGTEVRVVLPMAYRRMEIELA